MTAWESEYYLKYKEKGEKKQLMIKKGRENDAAADRGELPPHVLTAVESEQYDKYKQQCEKKRDEYRAAKEALSNGCATVQQIALLTKEKRRREAQRKAEYEQF